MVIRGMIQHAPSRMIISFLFIRPFSVEMEYKLNTVIREQAEFGTDSRIMTGLQRHPLPLDESSSTPRCQLPYQVMLTKLAKYSMVCGHVL